jgi:serine/threonine-protein kinase
MATVYLARARGQVGVDRFLALKVVHHHLASDPNFVEMFLDEAEIASQVRHPNVCSVFDCDASDGEYYMAMEYLVGEPCLSIFKNLKRDETADPALYAPRIARMLADACEGLHAAHELTDADGKRLEVIHRDISPQNLFVTYDGVAKLVDFGVASASQQRHKTRTGIVKGKFAYVAPELLLGERADRRADVWGMGVVAWELLTGERLFLRKSDMETLRAVTDHPIRPPSEVNPKLPPELDAVILRALARDPNDRYATARELGRDLARLAVHDGELITAADLAEWMEERFPTGRERNRQVLKLAAAVDRGEADRTPLRVSVADIDERCVSEAITQLDTSDVLPAGSDATSEPPALSAAARTPWHGWLRDRRPSTTVLTLSSVGAVGVALAAFVYMSPAPGLLGLSEVASPGTAAASAPAQREHSIREPASSTRGVRTAELSTDEPETQELRRDGLVIVVERHDGELRLRIRDENDPDRPVRLEGEPSLVPENEIASNEVAPAL